jgi:hypothetical protein
MAILQLPFPHCACQLDRIGTQPHKSMMGDIEPSIPTLRRSALIPENPMFNMKPNALI